MVRVRRPLVLLSAVTALVVLTAASCSGTSTDIGVGAAGRGDVVELVDAPAAVTAKAAATVTAPADGVLASVAVKSGDQVVAGQVLGVIDSPTAQSRLASARSALTALKGGGGGVSTANLAATQKKTDQAAATAFQSARDAAGGITDATLKAALLAQVDAAEKAYDEAAATARSLVSSVQRGLASISQAMSALTAAQRAQAQSAYDLAQSTVDALTLKAPVAGIVQLGGTAAPASSASSLSDLLGGSSATSAGGSGPGVDPAVGAGGLVTTGTPLFTVVDVSQLGLLASVDETDVLLVQPGVTADVELDAAPGDTYHATVTTIDELPSATAQGGVAYRVRLVLATGTDPDGKAAPTPKPGMNAVAHLKVRSARDTVTVPAAAVFNADGRDQVWTVRDGKAVRTPVTVGVAGQDSVQVVSGLGDGQQLVVRGADKVSAGMKLP